MFGEPTLHGMRDRMLALRSLPSFADLSDESALHLVETSRERRFAAGAVLFDTTDSLDAVYFVIQGKIEVTYDGRPFQITVTHGVVGGIAALANIRTGWRGVAAVETIALELPMEAFLANLAEDFSLLRGSLRVTATMALQARSNLPPPSGPLPELGEYPARDLTLMERAILLRSSPGPFSYANMEAIIDMCRSMEVVRVDPGHVFFEIGDRSDFSLRIEYGRIRCTSAAGDHVDHGAPMVIGVMDSWSLRPRSYSARAETPVVAYRTRADDALAVLEMHPTVALRMLADLARSLVPR